MGKETVLELLRQRNGDYLSGEEMSQALNLSRTAVWKAVDALRKEGYLIEACAGQGYRLQGTPDALTEPEIRSFLGETDVVGRELICVDEIDSTNTYAKKIAMQDAPDGTVVIANCQTAGRGRMDRSFQSPKGQGIYLTVLLRPEVPTERLIPVTAMAGVAVCRAVERVCGGKAGLKWPNDPVMGNRKVCGILTEMSLEAESGRLQYLVVGIGINVHQRPEDFPEDVQKIATSLSEAMGIPVSRPALAAALVEELDRLYAALKAGNTEPYLTAYRQLCVNLGKSVQLLGRDGSREQAEAIGIDQDFGLVVRMPDGEEKVVRSGEVSVRGLYGYVE